jgi:hypothetical protein
MESMEDSTMENRVVNQSSLSSEFSYKAHADLILRLTEECKCSLTKEDADAKP